MISLGVKPKILIGGLRLAEGARLSSRSLQVNAVNPA
ncbi:hypothetical protein RA8CHR_01970 [Variovorax sp. RA8]|nr:hypothetical protein RA8CHR_01970 [Variovorax sp. RA8]